MSKIMRLNWIQKGTIIITILFISSLVVLNTLNPDEIEIRNGLLANFLILTLPMWILSAY